MGSTRRAAPKYGRPRDPGFPRACLLLLSLLALRKACALPAQALPERKTYEAERAVTFAESGGGPRADLSVDLVDGAEDGPFQRELRRALYGGKDPVAYAEDLFEDFEKEYRAAAGESTEPEEGEGTAFPKEWYESTTSRLYALSPTVLTVATYRETFRGGTDDLSVDYKTFDRSSRAIIAFEDLFREDRLELLARRLESSLRKTFGRVHGTRSDADEALFATGIDLSPASGPLELTFAPVRGGIAFTWRAGAVAQRMAGPVSTFIPYGRLHDCLSEEARRLFAEEFTYTDETLLPDGVSDDD